MPETIARSLQENLITILAYDKTHGKVIAQMLDINLMEGDYRLIAERCIEYWRQYDTPPEDHLADLFADILEDKHNRRGKVITRHLKAMIALSESMNTQYVMNQLRDHHELQRIKAAIVESAEKINNNEQMALGEVKEIWHALLRKQSIDFNPGMRLNDISPVLARLHELATEFRTGIHELDKRGIVPQRGKLLLLGGAAGRGKTWGLIHIGKQALMDRKKVLHISAEIDEEEVVGRYYQSLFSVPKRDTGAIEITQLEKDIDALEGFKRVVYTPTFNLMSGTAQIELQSHWEHLGKKGENFIVKRFKPNEITGNALRAYLDTLETTEGFVPDLIIFDYLGLMKIDPKDKRGSLGFNCVELRSVAIERNCAMVTAHQLSKKGEEAPMAKGTHISEDWSIMGTADVVIIYSVTDLEFRYGLGRLYVAKARSEEDRFAILITQSYKVGQFCLESMFLQRRYSEIFKDFTADSDDYDADADGSEGEDDE
jgi:hypothetical protein